MTMECRVGVIAALLFGAFPLFADTPCQPLPVVFRDPSTAAFRQTGNTFIVASLNMAEEVDVDRIVHDLNRADPIHQADLLLLQEVLQSGPGEPNLPAELGERLGFHVVFAPGDVLSAGMSRGVAILSRFAIRDAAVEPLKHFDLDFKSRCRVALAVTIDSPRGPIRAVNVHLDSRINADERLAQLEPVVERLAGFSGPQLVGGDFNTANVLWLTRFLPLPYLASQASVVRTRMESSGFSTPFVATGRTFSYLPLRLDWVFLKGLQALDAGIEPIRFSDHRGIWVKVQSGMPQLR